MQLVLLSTDLITQSKISGAAQSLGLCFRHARSPSSIREACTDQATIVVLDLAASGYNPRTVVEDLKSLATPPTAILAFGPHVHESRLQDAVQAGCDAVFARGQFFAQAQEILKNYVN